MAHTAAKGSARGLQVRAVIVADGIGPSFQVRADRSLMPAAAAAVSNVCPCIRLLLRTRICSSVTIDLHRPRDAEESSLGPSRWLSGRRLRGSAIAITETGA